MKLNYLLYIQPSLQSTSFAISLLCIRPPLQSTSFAFNLLCNQQEGERSLKKQPLRRIDELKLKQFTRTPSLKTSTPPSLYSSNRLSYRQQKPAIAPNKKIIYLDYPTAFPHRDIQSDEGSGFTPGSNSINPASGKLY